MADRSSIRSRGGDEKKASAAKTPSSAARTLPPSAILDNDEPVKTPNTAGAGGSSRRDGDDDEEEPTADGMTAEEEAEAEKVLAEIEAAKKKAAKVAGDAPATVEISQGTVEEVERMHVKNSRQLLGYFITQPRIRFGKQVTFDDNDPEKIGEYRRTRVESYGLTRDTLDMGFQAAAEMKDATTQTEWRNKVNKVMQYESQTYSAEDEERVFNSELLLNFLDQAEMRCRQALQGNEAIDLFKDEFAQFEEEEQNSSSRLDNSLKELHAFHELALSRHKSVSGINWHPTRQGVVAFSCANNLTFEQWVDVSGKVLSSWVFIWHFSDPLHPQLLLEVPGDLQCFKINPHNSNYIIGGLATGQVIFWDLSEARAKMAMARDFGARHSTNTTTGGAHGHSGTAAGGGHHDKDNKGSMSHRGLSTAAGGGGERKGEEKASGSDSSITPIKPSFISYIDRSHSRPVTDIEWMQPQREMTRKGEMVDVKDGVKYSSQFMTVAGDGYLIVWDVRQQNTNRSQPRAPPPGVVVNNNQATTATGTSVGHDEHGGISLAPLPVAPINKEEARWVPLYTIPLNKEGGGTISAIKFATVDELGTKLMCVTEDGELAWVDWQPSKPSALSLSDRMSSAMMMSMVSSSDDKKTETVQRLAPVHLQACTSIQRSPHFPDMFLTSGDWTFTIWKLDFETPVFVSPYAHDYITAARWSPTRPGVIVAALANGQIDVWDFLDQCHKPTLTHPTGSESLTSIEFFQSKNSSQQLLAAGDALGKLHILEMPRNLRKKVGGESSSASAAAAAAAANAAGAHGAYYRKNPQAARLAFAGLTEEQTMKNFYDREMARVKYVGKRQVIRAAEKKQDDDARELANKRSQANASHTFEDRPHFGDTKEPAVSADAEAKAAIEEEKLETAYQKMLRDFKTMLVDQPAAAAAAAAEKARLAAEEAAKQAAAAAAAMTIVGATPPTPNAGGAAANGGNAAATARGLSVPLAGINGSTTAAGTRGGATGATSSRLSATSTTAGTNTSTTARGTARLAAGSGIGNSNATGAPTAPLVARQRVSAGVGS